MLSDVQWLECFGAVLSISSVYFSWHTKKETWKYDIKYFAYTLILYMWVAYACTNAPLLLGYKKKGGKGLPPTDHMCNDNYIHVLSMLFKLMHANILWRLCSTGGLADFFSFSTYSLSMQSPSRSWNSRPALHPCRTAQGVDMSLLIQSTCVLWTWRKPMTMSPREFCGGNCGEYRVP